LFLFLLHHIFFVFLGLSTTNSVKLKKVFPLVALCFILKFTISCVPESCQENTQSLLNASFYKQGTIKTNPPDSLTISGLNNGNMKIYNRLLKAQTIQLPLDPSTDTCGFVIKLNTVTDTLFFIYSSYPHMISKECGFTFYHVLDSYIITGTTVDTILISNKNITTFNNENIRIFY
jgi:hypothetical protein